jgi:hypothetical protein
MSSKNLKAYFSAVCFYIVAVALGAQALEDIKFVDVDEFRFVRGGLKSGLRVCVFDVQAQQYESISYYNIPATQNRKPDGVLLQDFHGITINYNGDVVVPFPLKNVIVRSKGTISGTKGNFNQWMDDERRNLAYQSLPFVSGSELMGVLNKNFGKGPYNQKEFTVTSYTLPSTTTNCETLGSISGDEKENNGERGLIGELATRMTLFCCGFVEKLHSQDNSGQGIDGVYIQRDASKALSALYLTESKCKNASVSPKKIQETQLTEKILYENIGRLGTTDKQLLLDFIAASSQNVFKAAHRILITGKSQWRVEKLDYSSFQVLRMDVSSPEKDKEIIITNIAPKFNSAHEMLRAVFGHYQSNTKSEKLAVFQQALGYSTDDLIELLQACKLDSQAQDKTDIQQNNQEDVKKPVARKLTYETPVKKEVEKETQVDYNRENLAIFLTAIKDQFKRGACTGINTKLKETAPDQAGLSSPDLTKLSDYTRHPTFHKTIDYKPLWDKLIKAFPNVYQQSIASNKFLKQAP